MKLRDYLFEVAPRAPLYEAARRGLIRPPKPLTLTYSVTAACRSLCKTCNIGRAYLNDPSLAEKDLELDEVERVFASLGRLYFLNISGGEPFMRLDLPDIIKLAAIHLKPRLIHIPTNALAPRAIEQSTLKILSHMDAHLPDSVPLSVKPSIDGIGAMHDYVRGIRGNWGKLEETIDRLLAVRAQNPRLHVDLGTVISNLNLHHLEEIEDWVHGRGIESYRHEIAEQRVEFHNIGDPITPPPDVYEELTKRFSKKIVENIHKKAFLTRTTEAVRVTYYQVASEILKQRRQVTPCYAGLSNIHMNYDGTIWPCCILGGEQALGNVRDSDYDMPGLLASPQARKAKRYIADGNCACPLANQWLNNVLLTPRHMARALYTLVFRFGRKGSQVVSDQPVRSVDPSRIVVNVIGTSKKPAIVLRRAGTVPRPTTIELPEFGAGAAAQTPPSRITTMDFAGENRSTHQVLGIRDVSPSTYVLRVERGALDFVPGQYVTIGKVGSADAREYTIYSGIEDEFLDFLIAVVDGGKVSGALRKCDVGDQLELEGPTGYFRVQELNGPKAKHCFISTGTGIAPFHSFTRSYPTLDFTLLHGVRHGTECYDRDVYESGRYIPCVSREKSDGFRGRVTSYVREHGIDAHALFYLCGNGEMIAEMAEILTNHGVPHSRIISDLFY